VRLRDLYIIREDRAADREIMARVDDLFRKIVDAASRVEYKGIDTDNQGSLHVGMATYIYEAEVDSQPWEFMAAMNWDPTSNPTQRVQVGPHRLLVTNAGANYKRGKNILSLEFNLESMMGEGTLATYGIDRLGRELARLWPQALVRLQRMYFHELVHVIDREKIGGRYGPVYGKSARKAFMGSDNDSDYYTLPLESNPNTLEAMDAVVKSGDVGSTPQEFARRVVDYMHRLRGEEYLAGRDLQRLQKRAATYWQHLQKP
jgi:hypothetical protein